MSYNSRRYRRPFRSRQAQSEAPAPELPALYIAARAASDRRNDLHWSHLGFSPENPEKAVHYFERLIILANQENDAWREWHASQGTPYKDDCPGMGWLPRYRESLEAAKQRYLNATEFATLVR